MDVPGDVGEVALGHVVDLAELRRQSEGVTDRCHSVDHARRGGHGPVRLDAEPVREQFAAAADVLEELAEGVRAMTACAAPCWTA